MAAPNTVSLPQQTLPITPNSPPQTTIIPQPQPQPAAIPTPTLPPVITISDSEEESGEELEAAVVVENNGEEIEGEETEEVAVEVSDVWQAQVDSEARIARLRRELDAEYNIYRNILQPQQQQFFDTSRTRDRHVNNYFNVVNAYRNRRTRDRTWEDDHPFTRYL